MRPFLGILNIRRAIAVFIALVACLSLTGQAFAQNASASSAPGVASHPTFSCQVAPHVQSPPTLKGAPAMTSSLRSLCGAGRVPQPLVGAAKNRTSFSFKGIAPAMRQGIRSNIAAGYHYVYGYQYATAIGAEGYLSQHTPYLSPSDSHTLAEIAGESSDSRQIVEIGWTVDRGVNGDANPHLFIFHWINGGATCYNGCGYVQYSSTLYPGMPVASGAQPFYAMENYQGNWWLWYNTGWIGYFPGTLWSNAGVTFTQLGLTQWFGEVSSGGGAFTQMGNGVFGSNAGSASFVNAALMTTTSSATLASVSLNATDPSCYNYGWITANYSFRYGGPGC